MTATINIALQNRQVDSWAGDLDLGSLKIYSGTQPGANDAPTGVLLWSFTFSADAFAAGVAGVAQKLDTITANAVASGVAGYAVFTNAAGTRWQYFSVTATGGGGDLTLSTLIVTNGQPVTVSSLSIIQPASQ